MNKAELYNKKSSIIGKMEELKAKNKNTWNDTDQDDFVGLGDELEVISAELQMYEDDEAEEINGRKISFSLNDEQSSDDIARNSKGVGTRIYNRDNINFENRKPQLASIGTLIRAWVTQPANKLEARALSEGTSTAGQELTFQDHLDDIIPYLLPKSTVLQAGANIVKLKTDSTVVPKITTLPTIAFRAEAGSVNEADPAFTSVTFAPKSAAVMFKVSNELMADSPLIDKTISRVLVGNFANAIDKYSLLGTGSSNQPKGVINFDSINTISMSGTSGSVPTDWINVINLIKTVKQENVEPTALIGHCRTWADFAKLKEASTNAPLAVPSYVSKVPWYETTQVPITDTKGASSACSKIITGDFRDLYIGIRQQLVVQKLVERYADTLQTGIVASIRFDVQPYHVTSFAYLDSIRGSST